jgi:phosphatidylinositol alpha-1,6-mannosyltransferase
VRILVVTPTFLPVIGGAELGIYETYQRLGRRHDVLVLTPRQPDHVVSEQSAADEYFEDMSFETRYFDDRLNPSKLPLPIRLRGILSAFSVSMPVATVRAIRNFEPDVLNFHFAIPCGISLLVSSAFTDAPSVLSLISRIDVLAADTPALRKSFLWWAMRSASLLVAISRYTLRWPRAIGSARIIPYGVDIDRFAPGVDCAAVRVSLGVPEGSPVLFALQRLSRVKRTDVLIRAMPAVLKRYPAAVLVVGGKGPEEEALKTLAADLGVAGNVIFAGYIGEKELPGYFALADIFAFHSTNETFGIIFAQAMAAGKPIVSVNATAIPEVVDDGTIGTLVEPLNPQQFAGAVVDLLGDEEKRRRFSTNGRHKAVSLYSWDSVAEQYERAFESLLMRS